MKYKWIETKSNHIGQKDEQMKQTIKKERWKEGDEE